MGTLCQYIGKQLNRVDDTQLKTRRIWKEPGDALEISDIEAPHYLQHPGEWRAISHAEYAKHCAEREQIKETTGEIERKWGDLLLTDLYSMRAQLETEIKRRESASSKTQTINPVQAEVASAEPVKFDPKDPATIEAAANRMSTIIKAIGTLDKNDPEDWAKTPFSGPRVPRVSEITGFKVSRDEITEAMSLLKAAA